MAFQRLTLQETQYDLDQKLYSLSNQHKNSKFNVTDIADFLPVGLLINHRNGSNIFMNKITEQTLNMTWDEAIGYGPEYQSTIIYNDAEYKRITNMIDAYFKRNDENEILSFFQKLRPIGNTNYEWMYITSKLFKRNKADIPMERLLIACPVNLMGDMASKVNRVLDENVYMKKNFRNFASLTKREKQILSLVASGYNNPQISEMLFISRNTVEQHRKHINAKTGCTNIAELIRFAEAFDLMDQKHQL